MFSPSMFTFTINVSLLISTFTIDVHDQCSLSMVTSRYQCSHRQCSLLISMLTTNIKLHYRFTTIVTPNRREGRNEELQTKLIAIISMQKCLNDSAAGRRQQALLSLLLLLYLLKQRVPHLRKGGLLRNRGSVLNKKYEIWCSDAAQPGQPTYTN